GVRSGSRGGNPGCRTPAAGSAPRCPPRQPCWWLSPRSAGKSSPRRQGFRLRPPPPALGDAGSETRVLGALPRTTCTPILAFQERRETPGARSESAGHFVRGASISTLAALNRQGLTCPGTRIRRPSRRRGTHLGSGETHVPSEGG